MNIRICRLFFAIFIVCCRGVGVVGAFSLQDQSMLNSALRVSFPKPFGTVESLYLLCGCVMGKGGIDECPLVLQVDGDVLTGSERLAWESYGLGRKLDNSASFEPALYFYRCAGILQPDAVEYKKSYHALLDELGPAWVSLYWSK